MTLMATTETTNDTKAKADKAAKATDATATTAEAKADTAEAKAEQAREAAVKARAAANHDGVVTFEGEGVAVIVGGPAGEDITAGIPASQGTIRTREQSTCVVDSNRHVGNAVPGTKVCSYHSMHYDNDGRPRKDVKA